MRTSRGCLRLVLGCWRVNFPKSNLQQDRATDQGLKLPRARLLWRRHELIWKIYGKLLDITTFCPIFFFCISSYLPVYLGPWNKEHDSSKAPVNMLVQNNFTATCVQQMRCCLFLLWPSIRGGPLNACYAVPRESLTQRTGFDALAVV